MTRQFKKLAHLLYECKYHIVFCPKYRYKILRDEVAKYIERKIHVLCSQKDGVEVIEINVQPDHVHLVVSIPPRACRKITRKKSSRMRHFLRSCVNA